MGSNGNEWEFIRLHRQHPQRLRCRSRADNLRALAIAMAQHAAAGAAARVLETACGTGIVTRALRDALPATAHLKATDLNREMMDVAREKVRAGEAVDFQVANGTTLPFADASFGTCSASGIYTGTIHLARALTGPSQAFSQKIRPNSTRYHSAIAT
jgi:SAM-dependent methyltransferase